MHLDLGRLCIGGRAGVDAGVVDARASYHQVGVGGGGALGEDGHPPGGADVVDRLKRDPAGEGLARGRRSQIWARQ